MAPIGINNLQFKNLIKNLISKRKRKGMQFINLLVHFCCDLNIIYLFEERKEDKEFDGNSRFRYKTSCEVWMTLLNIYL